jgi:hypothetical protein
VKLDFRPPVLLNEESVRELCRLARSGYETRHKRETFGFLFGNLVGHRLLVRRACYYRGGIHSRTGVVFPDWPTIRRIIRRRQEVGSGLRMRFFGNFHSHVEIAGWVFRGLSPDDRSSFRRDVMSSIETIVFLWPGPGRPARPSGHDIVGYEPRTGYHYRVRVYAKCANGIRRVKARVVHSGIVIVY